MTLFDDPGFPKRFRRTPWRFQQTFLTPLKNLQTFVATIVATHELHQAACVTIDQVVFEPKHLNALPLKYSLPARQGRGWSLTANGEPEVAELLEAALGDWVDFSFVPTPKPFVIFADHDQYTTFYANRKSGLNPVVESLVENGFKMIKEYERKL